VSTNGFIAIDDPVLSLRDLMGISLNHPSAWRAALRDSAAYRPVPRGDGYSGNHFPDMPMWHARMAPQAVADHRI
jgi:hypothetical protein